MSITATITSTMSVGGVSIQSTVRRTSSAALQSQDTTLAAGKAGSLTTRTSNTEGVVTLTTGHGLTDGSHMVDLYWDSGSRLGVSATISTNAVTITGGTGDNLPAATTATVMTVPESIDIDFLSSKIVTIGIKSTTRAILDFLNADDISVLSAPIELTANEAWQWFSDSGVASPFSGDQVASMVISNGTTTAGTLKLCGSYDSLT